MRTLTLGYAAIALQIAFGAIAVCYIHPVALMAVFLSGVPLGLFVARGRPGLIFPAIGLFSVVTLWPGLKSEIPVTGTVEPLDQTGKIPGSHWIAGHVTSEWKIATEYSHEETMRAGRPSRVYGRRRIAPLVSRTWSPQNPVETWVVAETLDSGSRLPWHPDIWNSGSGVFVRRTGFSLSGSQLLADRASKLHGLNSSSEPLILMQVISADAAQNYQLQQFATGFFVASSAWSLILLCSFLLSKILRRRP